MIFVCKEDKKQLSKSVSFKSWKITINVLLFDEH